MTGQTDPTADFDEEPVVALTDLALGVISLLRDGKLAAHRQMLIAAGKTIDASFGKLGMLWVFHMIRAAQEAKIIPPTDFHAADSFTPRGLELMWDGIGAWRG